jgi:hypothetical protein
MSKWKADIIANNAEKNVEDTITIWHKDSSRIYLETVIACSERKSSC